MLPWYRAVSLHRERVCPGWLCYLRPTGLYSVIFPQLMREWAAHSVIGGAVRAGSKPLPTVRPAVPYPRDERPISPPILPWKATRKIQQICHHFRLSEVVAHAATRLYTLALEHKFTRGRRSMHVVAVCVYVACRQKETRNYMLIDFSDLLQVRACFNLLEMGFTWLA